MTRRLNRFHQSSLDPRPRHSTVAKLKLATARAVRFAAIVLIATAALLLAGFGAAPAHATVKLTISPHALTFPKQEVDTTSRRQKRNPDQSEQFCATS